MSRVPKGREPEPARSNAHAPVRATQEASRNAPRSPAELANHSVAAVERRVDVLGSAIDALRDAYVANDPELWTERKQRLDNALSAAELDLQRAESHRDAASRDARQRLDAVIRAFGEHAAIAPTLTAPTGIQSFAGEDLVLEILRAPTVGGARRGFDRKQEDLQRAVDRLSPVDRRVLADRLRRNRSTDPIAAALARWTDARRQSLLQYLAGAAKRDALHREHMLRAERGIADATAALPHADRIQQSFGRHDLGAVRAQIGGGASDAATALGAHAYARGDRVAFASEPDLHTAAHEAAHVVQQRAGHAPSGGLDTPGDHLEQHANAVADAVVAGASAEPLLDQLAAGSPTVAVQRSPLDAVAPALPNIGGAGAAVGGVSQQPEEDSAKDPAKKKPVGPTTPDYINKYGSDLQWKIRERIEAVGLPQPHARLRWTGDKREVARVISSGIGRFVNGAPDTVLKRLMMLSYPADLFALVNEARRGPEGSRLEAVQIAVATSFDEPLLGAIQRMGTRIVVQLDLHGGRRPDASGVVASCPLDGVVAEVIASTANTAYTPKPKGGVDDTGSQPFARGLRTVTHYEWVRDPKLWNWIKVLEPHDATVEDVANIPFAGGEEGDVQQAYRIAASPPYFGIPFETAKLVEKARENAPPNVLVKVDSGPGPRTVDAGPLAASAISDDAAKAQAPAPSKDQPAAARSLERVRLQLDYVNRELTPWHANKPLAGAIAFADRRQAELAHDAKTASSWNAVLAAQERTLFAATSELTELLEDVAKAGGKPADAPSLIPVMRVIDAYAHAVAVSHLHAEAPNALAEARRMKVLLPLALAEDRVRVARADVAEQREAEDGVQSLEPGAARTPKDINSQLRRAADLRLAANRGQGLDPDAVERLVVDADETALRSRLVTLATHAHKLQRRAHEVDLATGAYPSGAWSVDQVCTLILHKVNGDIPSAGEETALHKHHDHSSGGWQARLDLHAGGNVADRRTAIKTVTHQLETFASELHLGKFLQWAYDRIAEKMLRDLIASIAFQIGVMIATGEVIGAAGAALRGLAIAGEIGTELREASLLYKAGSYVARLGVEAGANTLAGGAFGGDMTMRAFAENALAIVLTNAALKPFQGLLRDAAAVEAEIRTWGQLAARGGRAAAELVVDTGGSIGASTLAHAAMHGGATDRVGAEDWLNMSVSIAAAKFVHERTTGMQHRLVETGRQLGTKSFDKLIARAAILEQRSNLPKGHKPTPDEALDLLVERHKLLVAEHEAYRSEPRAKQALAANASDVASTGAQFADVPLQLTHLSPVVEGHIYEGTHTEITKAFQAAEATGVPLTREWLPDHAMWRVTSDKRVIEIHERGTKPHEERAAHPVPNSSFTGLGPTRRRFNLAELHGHVQSAATVLGAHFAADAATAAVTIASGARTLRVEFFIGPPDARVAWHHAPAPESTVVQVHVSSEARPEDLARAAAHELAEIRAVMDDPRHLRADALHHGSTSTDLSAHDVGRIAEVQVLLAEFTAQPGRRADITRELSALLEHLGFDPRGFSRDTRARALFGEPTQRSVGSIFDDPRTFQQLQADRNPEVRPGETAATARDRVKRTDDEIVRRAPSIMQQLGEHPRRVKVRSEDPLHAPDAHTIERHGSNIPLRRADAPGQRTVEGRLYGDPPWGRTARASLRWVSDSVMDDVIELHLASSWDTIRLELATSGEYDASFKVHDVVGEGFVNADAGGAVTPKYIRTSLVRMTIVLIPGNPPTFFILRAFPNYMGNG